MLLRAALRVVGPFCLLLAARCPAVDAAALTQDESIAEGEALGRELLEALYARPSGFRSGTYTVTNLTSRMEDDTLVLRRRGRLECAFANSGERLRLHSVETDLDQQGEPRRTIQLFYVRTPAKYVWYTPRGAQVIVGAITPENERRPEAYIDFRCVGLMRCDDMRRDTFEKQQSETREFLHGVQGTRLPNDRFELEVTLADGAFRRVYELDGKRKYAPLSFRQYYRPKDSDADWRLLDTTTVTWTNHSGVTVPAEIHTESRRSDEKLVFEWDSVNERVPDDMLRPESIPVLPGSTVADVLTDPGDPQFVGTMPEGESDVSLLETLRASWVVTVVILAAIGLGTVWFVRRRPTRGPASRWRILRRAGLLVAIMLALGCGGLAITTVWWRPYLMWHVVEPRPPETEFRFRLQDSTRDVLFQPVVETHSISASKGVVSWRCDKIPGRWVYARFEQDAPRCKSTEWQALEPLAAIKTARSRTVLGQVAPFERTAVAVPLLALANLFALWPAVHFWRRWRRARRRRRQET